jgi:hypothetical protein
VPEDEHEASDEGGEMFNEEVECERGLGVDVCQFRTCHQAEDGKALSDSASEQGRGTHRMTAYPPAPVLIVIE